MTDYYSTKTLPVFAGESKVYPAWRGKFYSGCCDRNPHVLNSSIQELETLKDVDLESVPPNKTDAEKAIRLKNKLIIKNNTQMWSSMALCVDGSTTKGKVAWLKIQKHKWTDGTGNSLAALAALDSKYNSFKTKDKQDMITEFYMFKMEASQKPDEVSAQLQVLQGELGLFADPHPISDKEVGLRLVASLPDGKTGQLGPYGAAKIALAKSITATSPDAFNLEGLEDDLNSIHKVLYPHMWNDENENPSTSDEQAMMTYGNGASQKKTKCPNCGKWHKGQCGGKNYKPGNSNNNNNNNPNDDHQCTHCGKSGHLENKCWKKKKGLPKSSPNGEAVNTCYEISLTCTEITLRVAMTTEELQTLEREETLIDTGMDTPYDITFAEEIPDLEESVLDVDECTRSKI